MFDFLRKKKERTELAKIVRTESAAQRLRQKYKLDDLPITLRRAEGSNKRRTRPSSLQLSDTTTTDSESSHMVESKRISNAKRRFTLASQQPSLSVAEILDAETSSRSNTTRRLRSRKARMMSLSVSPSHHSQQSVTSPLTMSTTFRQNTNSSHPSAPSSSALTSAHTDFALPENSLNCVVAHTPVIISPTTSHADRFFSTEIVDPDNTMSPPAEQTTPMVDEDAPPPTYREVEDPPEIPDSNISAHDDGTIITGAKGVTIASMTSQVFRPVDFLQAKLAPQTMSPLSSSQDMWVIS